MLRSTTSQLLNRTLVQRPIVMTTARPQSTLNTGEILDPQIGDYPNLPRKSVQTRGPFGWWDPQDKHELFGVWAPDLHHYSPYKALAQLVLAAGLFAGAAGIIYKTYPEPPAVKRTYPYEGLKKDLGYREDDVRPRGARPDSE
ncbi:unnamed protein product [Cunninghamella blakesleeana]